MDTTLSTVTTRQSERARLCCCKKTPKAQGLNAKQHRFVSRSHCRSGRVAGRFLLTKSSHLGQGKEAWQVALAVTHPAREGHTSHWPDLVT